MNSLHQKIPNRSTVCCASNLFTDLLPHIVLVSTCPDKHKKKKLTKRGSCPEGTQSTTLQRLQDSGSMHVGLRSGSGLCWAAPQGSWAHGVRWKVPGRAEETKDKQAKNCRPAAKAEEATWPGQVSPRGKWTRSDDSVLQSFPSAKPWDPGPAFASPLCRPTGHARYDSQKISRALKRGSGAAARYACYKVTRTSQSSPATDTGSRHVHWSKKRTNRSALQRFRLRGHTMKEAKLRPIRLSMARNIPLKASKTVKRVRHPSSLASIGPWPCPGPRPATMLQKIVKIVSDRPRCWEQLRMLCPIRNQHSRHCKTLGLIT